MPESFGARLRQRREQQQIALTTIAEGTKIKLSLLEGLERDDVSHWPAGIFRRAFIRGYAHAIGLEPDVVVREFLELYPDPVDDVETLPAAVPGLDGVRVGGGPPTRLRYLVGSAMASLSRGQIGIIQRRSPVVEEPATAPCPPSTAVSSPATAGSPSATAANPPVDVACPAVDAACPPVDAACPPVSAPAPFEPDLSAAAHLCTELARVTKTSEVTSLLREAVRILDAVGLIVWVWDPQTNELRPALAHGYPDRVLAQLPTVKRDADNATAAAFRLAQPCVVDGSDRVSGALVVPLMTPSGCEGVLAIEVQHGREQTGSVRALVTIFAAQLARWIGAERAAEIADRRLA